MYYSNWYRGQAIAAQLSESFPDAPDDGMAGRRPGDRNDQDPPQNDSYEM